MKTEDRIQINGTWYVKEEMTAQTKPQDLLYLLGLQNSLTYI